MKYDFVEIGTSCFETLLEAATPEQRGLSIEPIKAYLDKLPDKPNVTKLPFAVSPKNTYEALDIYYVPEDVIKANGLPSFLLGCNSIGGFHKQHNLLGITHLVKVEKVVCVPVSYLYTAFQIDGIDLLKIDVEGNDALIMLQLFDYIVNYGKYRHWPKKAIFESNELADKIAVEMVIQKYTAIGYKLVSSGYDTVIEL